MSESEELDVKIKQINEGLARYYANMGVKDYNNKFIEWINENDYDIDTVEEELNTEAVDSTIIEFDEQFPLPMHDNQDEEEVMRKIHAIIKNCYDNADAYLEDRKTTSSIAKLYHQRNFVIPETEKEDFHKLYATQCPSMYNSGTKEDKSFFTALIAGKQYEVEYVQHLFDLFMRDSVKAYNQNGTVLQPEIWAKTYPYFAKVKDASTISLATGAVKSFGTRICPRLLFNCTTKIQDSLEEITKYICESIHLVKKLAQKKEDTCPFQADICIAFAKTKNCQMMIGVDAADDDDDDEDDETFDEKEKGDEKDGAFYDRIGDIVKKLKSNKLKYVSIQNDVTKPTRVLGTLFDNFSKALGEDKFPMKQRFVAIIDRRDDDKETDEVIMYEAPENVKYIPNNAVPEWYLNASKTSILPHVGYDPKTVGKESSGKQKEEGDNFNINSLSSCGGALLTLSFHVKQTDNIKCYLYLNGQICRFFADDVFDILPVFFDMEFGTNSAFVDDATVKQQVDQVRNKLLDLQFSSVKRVWERKN